MHGPLSEIGLIEVLQLLERGGRSGVLSITGTHPAEPCQLYIVDGEIVALEPVAGDAATRRALIARHLIGGADAAADPSVLSRPVARQMRAKLASRALAGMIHWQRGRFDFVAGPVAAGPLAIAPDALVFEIVESESRRIELAEQMHEFRAVPTFAATSVIASGDAPVITADDWRLLDRVDGVRDVADLAALLDESVEQVAASIQSLQAALILELRQPVPDNARD